MQTIHIPELGDVEVKRSGRAKRVIFSIQPNGTPRVTVPKFVPTYLITQYVNKNKQWYIEHSNPGQAAIENQQRIGRKHVLVFIRGEKLTSRVGESKIIVRVPATLSTSSAKVQSEALKACTRAIRRQAEQYLPGKLHHFAQKYGYNYREVRCKALKSRWGSCSSEGIINLNIWLMQLPENLIDYVIAHELTHLNHPHHQSSFWKELSTIIPDCKERRRQLKVYRPSLADPA